MTRTSTALAWSCAALGPIVFAVGVLVGDVGLRSLAGVSLLVGAGITIRSVRVFRPRAGFVAAVVLLGVAVMGDVRQLARGASSDHLGAGADLLIAALLVAAIAALVQRRRGFNGVQDVTDAIIVVVGGAVVTWITIVEPTLSNGAGSNGAGSNGAGSASLVLLTAAALPPAGLAFAFGTALVTSGLRRNRAVWLLLAALTANLASAVVRVVSSSVGDGAVSPQWWIAGELAAFWLAVAATAHPSVVQSQRRSGQTETDGGTARVAIVLVALAAPLVLNAAIESGSAIDRTVRTIGTLLLAILAASRLLHAISASDTAERRLADRSRYDELTRLPNRAQVLDDITDELDDTWRTRHRPVVIQINVDRFKNINDSFGHEIADIVLVELAGRLREVASTFGGTVARISGDEFVVLDPDADDAAAAERAEAIRGSFTPSIAAGDHTVFTTASVGYATAPRNRIISALEFLRRADVAMHRAKADGRNRVARFDESMLALVSDRLDIENALHGAVEREEFHLDHQPIIDATNGTVIGFEALIRWRRSDGTRMRPDQFIPVAEDTGIINEMGAWALHTALVELRRWTEAGVVGPATTMSVNVSPRQIADPNLPTIVRDAIARAGVRPERLWIEVTESMMLSEPHLARATLGEIRAMGVGIALDDFGTGYSSLSLLQDFQLQRLKIDRAFVRNVAEVDQDRNLVRTIIAMAETLGLDVVAEGVETVEQLAVLRQLGCANAQGFLISRPVPPDMMRSTMIALADLGTLSVFTGVDETVGSGHVPTVDARDDDRQGVSVAGA